MAYTDYQKSKYNVRNSGSWDRQAFATIAPQVELDLSGAANLPTAFKNATDLDTFLSVLDSNFGTGTGFASLVSGKIPLSQIPIGVLNGMTPKGTVNTDTDIHTLMQLNIATDPDADDTMSYIVVTSTMVLSNAVSAADHTMQAPGDEGDSTFPITLEAGDWLVLVEVDDTNDDYTWAIINNTQQDASTAAKGLVRLSDAGDVDLLSGDDVITEGVLKTIIDKHNDGLLKDSEFSGTGFMKKLSDGNYAIDTNVYITSTGGAFNGTLELNPVGAGPDDESQALRFHYIDGSTPGYTDLQATSTGILKYGGNTIVHAGNLSSVFNELGALQALADTAGFIKKTGNGSYSIDTNTYSTTDHGHGNYLTNNASDTMDGNLTMATGHWIKLSPLTSGAAEQSSVITFTGRFNSADFSYNLYMNSSGKLIFDTYEILNENTLFNYVPRVTVSSSAPGTVANGDIWIDTSA